MSKTPRGFVSSGTVQMQTQSGKRLSADGVAASNQNRHFVSKSITCRHKLSATVQRVGDR